MRRTKTTKITATSDGALSVQFPYDRGLIGALKAQIPHSDRRWDPNAKVWLVGAKHGRLMANLIDQYLGVSVQVPKVVSSQTYTTQILKILYIGAAKDRGGEISAFGHCNGAWTVLFPLDVLQTWFAIPQGTHPNAKPSSLYAVLGVPPTVAQAAIKTAFRRLARQWHPDICKEPDATQQFQTIGHAYAILKDPLQRRKYDAGLAFEATLANPKDSRHNSRFSTLNAAQPVWRPPLRCGYILATGRSRLGRFAVTEILQWEDIVNAQGQILVTSWPFGAEAFEEAWV